MSTSAKQSAALATLPTATLTDSPYLIAAFETRLPTTTIAHFIDYYDNTHVPLIKTLTGASFPLSHSRHYLKHVQNPPPTSSDEENPRAFRWDGRRLQQRRRHHHDI
jgi:hypothetical protein